MLAEGRSHSQKKKNKAKLGRCFFGGESNCKPCTGSGMVLVSYVPHPHPSSFAAVQLRQEYMYMYI